MELKNFVVKIICPKCGCNKFIEEYEYEIELNQLYPPGFTCQKTHLSKHCRKCGLKMEEAIDMAVTALCEGIKP